jgi:plasmid stability protein
VPSLTLKNLPADLHRRLKARAARNRRSLNREVIECLRAAAMPAPLDSEALLARARALRQRVSGRLRERDLARLRTRGRP